MIFGGKRQSEGTALESLLSKPYTLACILQTSATLIGISAESLEFGG